MDTRKVLSGAIVWSMGLLVPLLYHALLMHAAVQEDGHIYSYHVMVNYFFTLPWIIWPYLVAMAVVGACLVVSGVKGHDDRSE
jgi:K+ transporter